ncbi:T9SS type A sorting domain-containing protein [Aquimarina sp. ERC-38]|uniref:T9SS type A sorting domain-containing protein n=1 Tax=Aquimarina sp. ERC-38 TaxID=2949996 RepID=UPI00224655AA|nr:T9SS type A sorting domain-containing protein [Aquimarina sp. ERC-38]UZO81049.1 T9SS type A sorting domain-containing protein [Aquimarina sp. ERC-38]
MKTYTLHLLFFLLPIPFLFAQEAVERTVGTEDQMLHISANLVVDTADDLLAYIDRAKNKGANTVLFSDSKLNIYGLNGTAGTRWDREMQKLVDGIKERDLKLNLLSIVMGFGNSLLINDKNLTTGYPIKKQPLLAENGILKPVATAEIVNGGFEEISPDNVDSPNSWGFQDAVGERTFIDTNVKRSGNASFRADARDNESSRIFTSFTVQPFHQYTLSFWIKAKNLKAKNVLPVILKDDDDKIIKDRLTNLRMSLPKENGGRAYFNSADNLTIDDWTEMRIAFNSQEATLVRIALAVFNGSAGSIWFDDVKIEDTPALNWLNRDDLPISATLQSSGQALSFDTDIERPLDESLGQFSADLSYDTQHLAPEITLKENSKINDGDIVEISGWHALPTANGQVSGSWNHPQSFANMRLIHQRLYEAYQPDAFLLNYSEIRTGGFEPLDTQYKNSGEALGKSIEQAFNDLFEVAPDADYYFWSDMIDPNHNAVEKYYQINSSLEGIWNYVDAEKVTLATWWEGDKITKFGLASLQFFADLGFDQILGAFYDENVIDNYNRWQIAANGIEDIKGSIYATWIRPRNFSQIEAFGDVWWENGKVLDNSEITLENKNIAMYPVPAENTINIKLPEAFRIKKIELYDLNARQVQLQNTEIATENDNVTIDVSSIAPGTYFVHLTGDDHNIIKEKISLK